MALCRSGGSLDFSSLAEDDCLARFLFLISATADSWSERVSYVYLLSWLRIDDTIGVVISTEAWNSWLAVRVGFRIPNPPNLHGKARRSLTSSLGAGIPLRAGMNFDLMTSSNGWSKGPIFSIALHHTVLRIQLNSTFALLFPTCCGTRCEKHRESFQSSPNQ